MAFSVEFLLLCAALIVLYFWLKQRRPTNSPPGPIGLPIVGNLLSLSDDPSKHFMKLHEKYGDIFSLNLGLVSVVVLNSASAIREAFAESSFSGRPNFEVFPDRTEGKRGGVLFTDGSVWVEQRRFILKNLRDFGFGKKSMEGLVQEEVKELIDNFKKHAQAGTPINTTNKFNTAVLNALWSIVSGKRYSHSDPVLLRLVQDITNTFRSSSMLPITMFFPFLRKIIPEFFLNGGLTSREGKAGIQRSADFMRGSFQTHKETLQENTPPRDFIDVYLTEISKTTDPHSSFYAPNGNGERNLLTSVNDLFIAGAETTATSLSWTFLLLAMNPEKQEKLFEEIKNIVGLSRLPTLEDKPLKNFEPIMSVITPFYRMPYTEAVMLEVLRIGTVLPLGVGHRAIEDTTFRGYKIAKDTLLLSNLYGVHHDPKVWGDPEAFRPERFLNPDESKVIRREEFLAFSVGKRVCLGESLARAELFMFTASLFQRFEVKPDPNSEPLKMDYYVGPIMSPKSHQLILRDRFD